MALIISEPSPPSKEFRLETSIVSPRNEPRIIVVAVDATKELHRGALKYALDVIFEPGDKLYLLGILHTVNNPMGYKQKADLSRFNGTNNMILIDALRKKENEYESFLRNDPELQNLFASKRVKPEVQIAPGRERRVVTATQAGELQAKWVILDEHLKGDKKYLMGKLNCNLVLMKPKNQTPVMIQSAQFEDGYQATLDKSIELAPLQIMDKMSPKTMVEPISKEVSKSMSTAASFTSSNVSSSSGSLQQALDSTTISTQTPDEYSISNHSEYAWTLSGRVSSTISDPKDEYLELNGELDSLSIDAQYSDHSDSSTAKGTVSTGFRRDAVPASDERDRKSGASESEKNHSESEGDPGTPTAVPKVGSAGDPSEDAFYKILGRPSMSTGDLESLMPQSSSVATLYRPAPRSADRAGDELLNILNPTQSTSSPAEAPRFVRTLKSSLQEEDLNLQSSDFSNSPVGKVDKFESKNEANRHLLDNSVHSKRTKARSLQVHLCSQCKTPGPEFGRDARKFTYAELEKATCNFDQENYIAEGGYGFVYRGRLEGGQEIAVKQYKAASSQGDDEFFSEVDVLKHAQHRNLVILIGYCIENLRRLLVYEFVCNKSLDVHLSAKNVNVLEWRWRWKIAVGAARGLRYLHEECRVGCIVHRDLRPNNILLTHDYVPMVGDFGLARSQSSGDQAEETRVIGTLGYLAPEYAETGSITEKADVYSFGVVLLELATGRKAIDATRMRGETCLTEWARPLLQPGATRDMIARIVDPRLKDDYDVDQVEKIVDTAARCISKDPAERPRMSEVLRFLERDSNREGSLSRVDSGNDIVRGNSVGNLTAEIPRHEHLSKLPGRVMPREGSLESVVSLSKGNGASGILLQSAGSNTPQSTPMAIQSTRNRALGSSRSPQSTPMAILSTRKSALGSSKSEKFERPSSPRTSTSKQSGSRTKQPPSKLSYGDML